MFSYEYSEAAVEVLDILDNTYKPDVEKIPKNFIKFLVEIASEDYISKLDHSKTIDRMEIQEKTKELLGYIYINWWSDKNEKEVFLKKIDKNEQKRQDELKKKYNVDNIFENRSKLTRKKVADEKSAKMDNMQMIEYKEKSLFKNILNKILSIFQIKN